MTDLEWSPITVRLGDLSHWAENPVTLSKAQAKKLLKSTERLGRMQTLAIGPQNGDGKHPLYDGHQRVNVWGAAFGMELQVNALQSSRPLTDEERHQVPIMLRSATGSFDWQALSGWDTDKLGEWGLDFDALQGWNNDACNLREMLQAEEEVDPNAEWQGMPEHISEEIRDTAICCLVRFRTEEDRQEFEKFLGYRLSHKGNTYTTWFPKQDFDQLGRGTEFRNES